MPTGKKIIFCFPRKWGFKNARNSGPKTL